MICQPNTSETCKKEHCLDPIVSWGIFLCSQTGYPPHKAVENMAIIFMKILAKSG
jgi:hypothetical protein